MRCLWMRRRASHALTALSGMSSIRCIHTPSHHDASIIESYVESICLLYVDCARHQFLPSTSLGDFCVWRKDAKRLHRQLLQELQLSSSTQAHSLETTLFVSSCLLGYNVTYHHDGLPSSSSTLPESCPLALWKRLPNDKERNTFPREQRLKNKNPSCGRGKILPFFFLRHILAEGQGIRLIPICPEMDVLGLPSPRPPMQLVQGGNVYLHHSYPVTSQYKTAIQETFIERDDVKNSKKNNHVGEIIMTEGSGELPYPEWMKMSKEVGIYNQGKWSVEGIDGFIMRDKSPSCGVKNARWYVSPSSSNIEYDEHDQGGMNISKKRMVNVPYQVGDGFFVSQLKKIQPHVNVIGLGQLNKVERTGQAERWIPGFRRFLLEVVSTSVEREKRKKKKPT